MNRLIDRCLTPMLHFYVTNLNAIVTLFLWVVTIKYVLSIYIIGGQYIKY